MEKFEEIEEGRVKTMCVFKTIGLIQNPGTKEFIRLRIALIQRLAVIVQKGENGYRAAEKKLLLLCRIGGERDKIVAAANLCMIMDNLTSEGVHSLRNFLRKCREPGIIQNLRETLQKRGVILDEIVDLSG